MKLNKQGYSLVEVTLAILVVGVGLLSAFSLFPEGLNMSQRAQRDTEAALFAEEVFSGLHGMMNGLPDAWINMTNIVLYPAAPDVWNGEDNYRSMRISVGAGAGIKTIDYVYDSLNQTDQQVTERTIQYELLTGSVNADIKYAYLRVWPGEFGYKKNTNAVTFYTEFYNFGM